MRHKQRVQAAQAQAQAPALAPELAARILRLSKVEAVPRNYRGALLQIDSHGTLGETTVLGAKLIGDISKAHNQTAKPPYMLLLDSTTHPGDLIGLPDTTNSPDHIGLQWPGKGRRMATVLAKVLALKQIQIPAGTRMEIELYADHDPVLGEVVGVALKDAIFAPKTTRKSSTRQSDTQA